MSLVLAFDTATEAVGLGIMRIQGDAIEVLADESIPARRQANQLLLSLVVQRLSEQGLSIDEVDEIVVGRGPGSFTGVRIGVAAAKGLAQGLGVPLYGASTMEAIAVGIARDVGDGLVGVVGDAMRGEVYPALFEVSGGNVIAASPDRVGKPMDVAAEWAAEVRGELVLAGNGLAKYREVFEDALGSRPLVADVGSWYPTGTGLLSALRRETNAPGAPQSGDPATVLPVYTRLSDAEENERARCGVPVPPPSNGVAGVPAQESSRPDAEGAGE